MLADGWNVFMSRSEPHEPFYYHIESNTTQWERPETTQATGVARL